MPPIKQNTLACTLLLSATLTFAQAPQPAPNATPENVVQHPAVAQVVTEKAENSEQKALATLRLANEMREETLKKELAQMQEKITKLKLQRELLTEQHQLEELKTKQAQVSQLEILEAKLATAEHSAKLEKAKVELLKSQHMLKQADLEAHATKLQTELDTLALEQRRNLYSDSKPVYLENPLSHDGQTLTISDRRIPLSGPITSETADYITDRLHYYNNKSSELPIFIVIGNSPGGSVMAGYRILKAMEGSDAPVHVVVKSFAASMAAAITALAEHSYAYPNAIILHHQISSSYFFTRMNLTQQKEAYEDSQRWWKRLASPIAKKMGITTDEFIKQMYANNSDGDWYEFADKAQELKWVNHTVSHIKETGQLEHPDLAQKKDSEKEALKLPQTLDEKGKPCIYLPRINPHDVYFLYCPDNYYRLR